MLWAFATAAQNSVALDDFLKAGWEPFASDHASSDSSGDRVMLRKPVEARKEAAQHYHDDDKE